MYSSDVLGDVVIVGGEPVVVSPADAARIRNAPRVSNKQMLEELAKIHVMLTDLNNNYRLIRITN